MLTLCKLNVNNFNLINADLYIHVGEKEATPLIKLACVSTLYLRGIVSTLGNFPLKTIYNGRFSVDIKKG